MREKLREDRYEFLFLLVVGVVVVWAYLETTRFMPISAIVPQYILYLIAVALVAILVMKVRGDEIKEAVGISGASAGFDLGGDEEESGGKVAGLYDLNTFGVVKEFVWITAYVLGVIYVGFFTVSAVFSVVYILVNERSSLVRRIPLAIGWTGLIMGVLYLLFIEFLRVSSVWRLGFLP